MVTGYVVHLEKQILLRRKIGTTANARATVKRRKKWKIKKTGNPFEEKCAQCDESAVNQIINTHT